MHTANRLMRLLAGAKFGTKKKDYRLVQQALPARMDWHEQLTKEGALGGMNAKHADWGAMPTEHVSCAPPLPPRDMNHNSQGRKDVKLLKEYAIHAQKRKAVPQGTIPCEILVHILAPKYRKSRRRRRRRRRNSEEQLVKDLDLVVKARRGSISG